MARKPRYDMAGYHHVINRGVNKSDIFEEDIDKDTFLNILCKACRDYNVVIHDYCLMSNHYHILAETKHDNLSLFMRQINSNYAIYFNKKYGRSGHLWQGRYKSWYVIDENYLYTLFKYIEHNPIEAKICSKVGEYKYTLLSSIVNKMPVIKCAKSSKLLNDIKFQGIQEHLNVSLSDEELDKIKLIQKQEVVKEGKNYNYKKKKELSSYFKNQARDKAILKALDDGYKQSQIAKYLNLTPTAISKIKKKYRD